MGFALSRLSVLFVLPGLISLVAGRSLAKDQTPGRAVAGQILWRAGARVTATAGAAGGVGARARAASNLSGLLYADQFPGADIGARVNAAIAAGSGGTVVVPAGVYTYATPIVVPRSVSLVGRGGFDENGVANGGTVLEFTGRGCGLIVGDAGGPPGHVALMGANGVAGLVLVGNAGGAVVAGRYGICLGADPNADGSYWAGLGDLSAYDYRFRDLEIVGFDHGIEWGSNAFNLGFSGLQIDDNNIGITEVGGIANSNSNNWFARTVWYANSGGALLQPSGGSPGGADLHCVQCDFEWNNGLSKTSTSAARAVPQVTGGMSCVQCHFEAWGGIAWQTTDSMINPHVTIVDSFFGADSSAIGNEPVAFSFGGAGVGPQVAIYDLYLNTAHAIVSGIACFEEGSNPECDVRALPLPGGKWTRLVETVAPGGSGLLQGTYINDPVEGIWRSGSALRITGGSGRDGLSLRPASPGGKASASPTLNLYQWTGGSLAEYREFIDAASTMEFFRVGGGGAFHFAGKLSCPVVASTTANPAASGVLRLAGSDVIAWRNAANTGDLTLEAPTASGSAATTRQLAVSGTLTTTDSRSDSLVIRGVNARSHCVVTAANSAAAALAGVYVLAADTNRVTVAHGPTAGAIFNVVCTVD